MNDTNGPIYTAFGDEGARFDSRANVRHIAKGFGVVRADGTTENYVEDPETGKAIPAAEWFEKRAKGDK